ncbi:MAG: AbrB/MazE/SpoVT family DNA-binding domain-containing protein [Spirochaetaceae bacterium]|nr:AbrB/MazE/SpoVT family DNA-binding domain-containing protein [Spirochaetaceae bacterium]
MEVARVTSKGQITIPRDIRGKMNIKQGDKIVFFEDNGKCFFQNSASIAIKTLEDFQKLMKGEAKKAGFTEPEDVEKYIKSIRKEKKK